MMSNEEPWETEIRRYLDFLVDSDSEEDLVAVLRAHLYIEIALTALLDAGSRGALNSDDMTYNEKVGRTKSLGILDKNQRKMLVEIGALRNRFSHLPIKTTVDEHDLSELTKTLPPKIASAVARTIEQQRLTDGEHGTPSAQIRMTLKIVFNWISSQAAHERDKRKSCE